MDNLKINIPIPDGYEFDSIDKANKQINLKAVPKKLEDRFPDLDSIFKVNGTTASEFYDKCSRAELTSDEVGYRLVKMIVKAFNGDQILDWDNPKQYKYYPWFWMNKSEGGSSGFRFHDYGGWPSASNAGSRLCFMDEKAAKYAATHPPFVEAYRKFFKD